MKRFALVAAAFALAACGPDRQDRVTVDVDTAAPVLMPAPADTTDTLGVRDTLTPPATP